MAKEFKLPDLGEGIHEGEVLAVRVSVGQAVKEGDIILEVETDKAAVEIPSPYTGTVLEILVTPGDTVKVGQVLMTFSAPGEKPAAAPEPCRSGPKGGNRAGAGGRRLPGPRPAPGPGPGLAGHPSPGPRAGRGSGAGVPQRRGGSGHRR